MPSPFVSVLRTPGGLGFSAAGFVARIPLSMISIAAVLLVSEGRDSYTLAGVVSATAAVSEGLGQPVIARLVDRYGQRRVMTPAVAAHVVFLTAFVGAVSGDAPVAVLVGLSAATGATFPPIGSLVRARWAALIGEGPLLRTAFSWESVLDELVFVIGPPLAAVLAASLGPAKAMLSTLLFLVPGAIALLAQTRTEPPLAADRHERRRVLRARGVGAVMLVMFFLGGVFGSVEVTTIAAANEAGRPAIAGGVLAAYAAGSLLAGIVFGQVHLSASPRRQFLIGLCAMALTTTALPLTNGWAALTVAVFAAGAAISPTLITGFGLATALAPEGSVTEAITWASSGLVFGFAAGSAAAGALVDAIGPSDTYWLSFACAAAAAVVGALSAPVLTPRARAVPA